MRIAQTPPRPTTAPGCLSAGTFLLVMPVLIGVQLAIAGYALSTLWGWFMVPTFGLPALSIPAASGVDLVVSYTHSRRNLTSEEQARGLWTFAAYDIRYAIVKAVTFLAIGAALHHWWPL